MKKNKRPRANSKNYGRETILINKYGKSEIN